jgi:hypothetical protein
MKKVLLILLIFFFYKSSVAQNIIRPAYLHIEVEEQLKNKILQALDSLFFKIDTGKLTVNDVATDNAALSISIFSSLKSTGKDKKQLINFYPLNTDEYLISIAYLNSDNNTPALKTIFDLIAKDDHGRVTFGIPTQYYTRLWNIKTVGDVTYHYSHQLNLARAKNFDANNTTIAQKLGLKPQKLNFYLCSNYQDVLRLLGYTYDASSNGKTKDGYGVDEGCIFSIMNNEDFSHDVFHYYSQKIRTGPSNSLAEEGIAYLWGNAYYTDDKGGMILQKELVLLLKKYLQEHPETSVLELFNKNPAIFNSRAKVRSVISGILCNEVEHKSGVSGIRQLINCGKGEDNYFKVVDQLTGINKANLDTAVRKLMEAVGPR